MSNLPALHTVSDMTQMANAIAKSNLFGMKTPEQALALMLLAQAEGLHPATAARDYHLIQGRPSLKADAMLARFQQAGGRVEWHQLTDDIAEATFSHPHGGTLRLSWDIARAKRAGLSVGRDSWAKYSRAMLRARLVSEGIRSVFPAVVCGVYTPEEVMEFDTPASSEPAPVPVQTIQLPPPPVPEDRVTNQQLARMFVILKNRGIKPETLRLHLTEKYGITSSKEITQLLYPAVMAWIEGDPGPEGDNDEREI